MSDTDFSPPSTEPGNEGDLAGALTSIMQKFLQNVDDMLPAQVVAYDPATNRATVQPLAQLVTTDGRRVSRATVASVPVLRLGCGLGMLYVPVAPGDFGWLKASDRDISAIVQDGQEAAPHTRRMHSFQDGLFIPDAIRRAGPTGDDAGRLVLTWDDGSRVVVGPGTVEVHGVASVKVVAPEIELDGAVHVTGALMVDGGVTGSGGIKLETHKHSGVSLGSATSGGPVA